MNSEYLDVPLAKPIITEEMVSEAERVLKSEYYDAGASVESFESAFADFVGTKYAVAVDSGTRALQLSLEAAGIGDGDTVLTTPATFISTANAIINANATPSFVDVSLDTYTLDFEAVKQKARDSDFDAVIPVHLYGYPVDVTQLREIVGDTTIVADACQAHGAQRGRARVGSMSTAAAFSFYPSKNMTVAGDGGIITTDDPDIEERARMLRNVGRDETGDHRNVGYTARLNTINAALGEAQLSQLEDWNARRAEIAKTYTDRLDGIGDIQLPPVGTDSVQPAWYLYVIRTAHRDELLSYLSDYGIETRIHYPKSVTGYEPYMNRGFRPEETPEASRWASTVLSLPVHPSMTDEQVTHVWETVRRFYKETV